MLEAKTIQKYKSKSLSWLIDKAQELVNAYVRKRDSLYDGDYFICISCDKLKPKSQCNAGHFYSRGNFGSVRFNLDNIHLDYITNEDPKIKGEAETKIRAALDEFATDFA